VLSYDGRWKQATTPSDIMRARKVTGYLEMHVFCTAATAAPATDWRDMQHVLEIQTNVYKI